MLALKIVNSLAQRNWTLNGGAVVVKLAAKFSNYDSVIPLFSKLFTHFYRKSQCHEMLSKLYLDRFSLDAIIYVQIHLAMVSRSSKAVVKFTNEIA